MFDLSGTFIGLFVIGMGFGVVLAVILAAIGYLAFSGFYGWAVAALLTTSILIKMALKHFFG
jgi:hypothetical protein